MTPLTIGSEIWGDDNKLSRVFRWLTRIGAAPKFGSMPIHYYQQDQVKAIESLTQTVNRYIREGAPVIVEAMSLNPRHAVLQNGARERQKGAYSR